MSSAPQKEEVFDGVSTADVPNAKWGWSGLSERSLQISGWISVVFLIGMIKGNHHGNVENIWLISIAVLIAIGLLLRAFSPKGTQVTKVTAHNKPVGHQEPDWARDQREGTGVYAELTESQLRSWNREPGVNPRLSSQIEK